MSRFGVLDVQSLLDEGGMDAIFRARDTRLGRDAANKVLFSQGIRSDGVMSEGG